MKPMLTGGRPGLALALLALAAAIPGCASLRYGRMSPPEGTTAFGLPFGRDRAAVERALRAASVPVRAAADDADALVAERCPSAPVDAPCRLIFGASGLYGVQLEVPAGDAEDLAASLARGLGPADVVGDGGAAPRDGLPALVAAWHLRGWTVTVAKAPPRAVPAVAALRVENDAFAPPVVAGVALGRLREDVEGTLERQGATVVQREPGATTYLGCPQGEVDALSCVVVFRAGRAAAVTEIRPSPGDDRSALVTWRALAARLEKDIGRPPALSCPEAGPDRVGGDCTATWVSDRLVVVVGAHRNAGASHRGTISVYTAFTYPPLAGKGGDEEADEAQ